MFRRKSKNKRGGAAVAPPASYFDYSEYFRVGTNARADFAFLQRAPSRQLPFNPYPLSAFLLIPSHTIYPNLEAAYSRKDSFQGQEFYVDYAPVIKPVYVLLGAEDHPGDTKQMILVYRKYSQLYFDSELGLFKSIRYETVPWGEVFPKERLTRVWLDLLLKFAFSYNKQI